ncbi:unnamed protein product, partial [Polarella glacialis]
MPLAYRQLEALDEVVEKEGLYETLHLRWPEVCLPIVANAIRLCIAARVGPGGFVLASPGTGLSEEVELPAGFASLPGWGLAHVMTCRTQSETGGAFDDMTVFAILVDVEDGVRMMLQTIDWGVTGLTTVAAYEASLQRVRTVLEAGDGTISEVLPLSPRLQEEYRRQQDNLLRDLVEKNRDSLNVVIQLSILETPRDLRSGADPSRGKKRTPHFERPPCRRGRRGKRRLNEDAWRSGICGPVKIKCRYIPGAGELETVDGWEDRRSSRIRSDGTSVVDAGIRRPDAPVGGAGGPREDVDYARRSSQMASIKILHAGRRKDRPLLGGCYESCGGQQVV